LTITDFHLRGKKGKISTKNTLPTQNQNETEATSALALINASLIGLKLIASCMNFDY
jgi:hypothetical protein